MIRRFSETGLDGALSISNCSREVLHNQPVRSKPRPEVELAVAVGTGGLDLPCNLHIAFALVELKAWPGVDGQAANDWFGTIGSAVGLRNGGRSQ
jgi:hypothetical protein